MGCWKWNSKNCAKHNNSVSQRELQLYTNTLRRLEMKAKLRPEIKSPNFLYCDSFLSLRITSDSFIDTERNRSDENGPKRFHHSWDFLSERKGLMIRERHEWCRALRTTLESSLKRKVHKDTETKERGIQFTDKTIKGSGACEAISNWRSMQMALVSLDRSSGVRLRSKIYVLRMFLFVSKFWFHQVSSIGATVWLRMHQTQQQNGFCANLH